MVREATMPWNHAAAATAGRALRPHRGGGGPRPDRADQGSHWWEERSRRKHVLSMRVRRQTNRLTWQIIRGASGDCGGGLKASVVEVGRDICGDGRSVGLNETQQALLRSTSRRIRMKDRVDVLAVRAGERGSASRKSTSCDTFCRKRFGHNRRL